jgi:hypothetical protein
MIRTPLLFIHIAGALVGLLAGWTALFFRKGSRWHGAAGTIFFFSMIGMCTGGVILAVMKQQVGNVFGGTLTFYLVGTAWLTVKRREGETGRLEFAAMLAAFAAWIVSWTLGLQVLHSATAPNDGVPAMAYFILGSVALLAAAGDARMFLRGGVFGAARIVRHLWRMCTALLITTLSGLAGQRTHIFPEAIRNAHLFGVPVLTLPVFVLPILMIFWLFRVKFSKQYKTKAVVRRIAAAPANSLA